MGNGREVVDKRNMVDIENMVDKVDMGNIVDIVDVECESEMINVLNVLECIYERPLLRQRSCFWCLPFGLSTAVWLCVVGMCLGDSIWGTSF